MRLTGRVLESDLKMDPGLGRLDSMNSNHLGGLRREDNVKGHVRLVSRVFQDRRRKAELEPAMENGKTTLLEGNEVGTSENATPMESPDICPSKCRQISHCGMCVDTRVIQSANARPRQKWYAPIGFEGLDMRMLLRLQSAV